MKSVISNSLKLKARAYQYQLLRFGPGPVKKPLTCATRKAISAAMLEATVSSLSLCRLRT